MRVFLRDWVIALVSHFRRHCRVGAARDAAKKACSCQTPTKSGNVAELQSHGTRRKVACVKRPESMTQIRSGSGRVVRTFPRRIGWGESPALEIPPSRDVFAARC